MLISIVLLIGLISTSATACTAKLQPGAKQRTDCSAHGTLQSPAIQSVHPGVALDGCANICLARTNCLSFSYSKSNTQCVLYTKTLASQGFQSSKSISVYYDRSCYVPCPTKTTKTSKPTSTYRPELVPNGGFETGELAPWQTYASYDGTVKGDEAYSGLEVNGYMSSWLAVIAAVEEDGASSDSYAEIYQENFYTLQGGVKYNASFFYQVDRNSYGDGTLTFTIFTGEYTYIDKIITLDPPHADSLGTFPGSWGTFSSIFTAIAESGDPPVIGLGVETSGPASLTVYVDDVYMFNV